MEMKIEWVLEDDMLSPEYCDEPGIAPVVRLAEVDALLTEAVWAMERLDRDISHADYARQQAFLASPLVAAWRERQKKEA